MKLIIVFALSAAALLPTQAFAENCPVVYDNAVKVLVRDNSASKIGGAMFGVIGALVGSATDKSNNNSTELSVKKKIDQIDNSKYLKSVYDGDLIVNEFDKLDRFKCYFKLKLLKNEISYVPGSGTIFMKFQISHFRDGSLIKEENKSWSKIVGSPVPVQPRAKYKRGTNGKWINITPPAPTQEEALEIFILSYEENVANLYKKLVKQSFTKP